MIAEDRAEFTDHFAGIPAQIRWLELEQWLFEVWKKAPKELLAECAIYSGVVEPMGRTKMGAPMRKPRVETR